MGGRDCHVCGPEKSSWRAHQNWINTAFSRQQYAWNTSKHGGNVLPNTSWLGRFPFWGRTWWFYHSASQVIKRLPYKKHPLTPFLSTGWIHSLALLLGATLTLWEKRNLWKLDEWASSMAFSFEHSASGADLLITGSSTECQQASRQEVKSHSCILSTIKTQEKNVITHYKTLQKLRNCDLVLTLSVTAPSELSEESKSGLHGQSKGNPKVTGRFYLIKGRVFSVVF